jgi:hypothetical protein
VFVTHDQTHCDELSLVEGCQVLLRVQDERGRSLAGARFDGKPSAVSKPDLSDAFGRLFRALRRGEELAGVVVKEGYGPERVTAQCVRNDENGIEMKIVLKRALR